MSQAEIVIRMPLPLSASGESCLLVGGCPNVDKRPLRSKARSYLPASADVPSDEPFEYHGTSTCTFDCLTRTQAPRSLPVVLAPLARASGGQGAVRLGEARAAGAHY